MTTQGWSIVFILTGMCLYRLVSLVLPYVGRNIIHTLVQVALGAWRRTDLENVLYIVYAG